MMSVAHCGGTLRMGKVCLLRLAWSRLLVLHGAWWSATEKLADSYSLLACLAKVTIIVTTVLSTVNYLPTHFVPAKDITTIYQLFTIRLSKQQVEPMIKTTTEHSREGMDEIKTSRSSSRSTPEPQSHNIHEGALPAPRSIANLSHPSKTPISNPTCRHTRISIAIPPSPGSRNTKNNPQSHHHPCSSN